MFPDRVLSGMRPTGKLHLGHYHGVLKNWVKLQSEYQCLFMVADWHALTTNYDDVSDIEKNVWDMVIDWIAAGVDPAQTTVFIQSRVPEHAELQLLLSMITPLSWLERTPSYKDQIEKLSHKDLDTFGFLGYPLLQAADILLYRSNLVPVGEDQVPHIEITRDIARRFNHVFGKEVGFVEKAEAAIKKIGGKKGKLYDGLRTRYQQDGDVEALESARSLLQETQNLSHGDRERLFGYLEGGGKMILPEAQPLLTNAPRLPGLDGLKMSKSYGNTISLRESADVVAKKINQMPTDPARARRADAGEPERCPVWKLHQVYSDTTTQQWVVEGCKSAGIGCLECKQPVIEGVLAEQKPMFERAQPYLEDMTLVKSIVADGCEKARDLAKDTMRDVRESMGLAYS
ncbi:MAG: tryptophan--tRNA ligase [Proteobacteria bacterium]|nr:tryptophan--tRNA ligase [Pseudomonadota bacterium]